MRFFQQIVRVIRCSTADIQVNGWSVTNIMKVEFLKRIFSSSFGHEVFKGGHEQARFILMRGLTGSYPHVFLLVERVNSIK